MKTIPRFSNQYAAATPSPPPISQCKITSDAHSLCNSCRTLFSEHWHFHNRIKKGNRITGHLREKMTQRRCVRLTALYQGTELPPVFLSFVFANMSIRLNIQPCDKNWKMREYIYLLVGFAVSV